MLRNYKELKVWESPIKLCLEVYQITKGFPKFRHHKKKKKAKESNFMIRYSKFDIRYSLFRIKPSCPAAGTTKHENTAVGAGLKPAPTEPQQRVKGLKIYFRTKTSNEQPVTSNRKI